MSGGASDLGAEKIVASANMPDRMHANVQIMNSTEPVIRSKPALIPRVLVGPKVKSKRYTDKLGSCGPEVYLDLVLNRDILHPFR